MKGFLIRHMIYPFYRRVKRDHVLDYLHQMRIMQERDPEEIRRFQFDKLKSLLRYAAAHVPYYRKLFRDLGIDPEDFRELDDIKAIPPLHKSDINRCRRDFLSEVYPQHLLEPDSTGGSTGEILYFFVDRSSSEARRANNVRMDEWIGISVGDRTALLWGVQFGSSLRQRVKNGFRDWISNRMLLSAYRMDPRTVDYYLKRLRKFKPDLLIGYPSALTHFCESIMGLDHGLKPKAILSSGETLYDWQRETIEKALGAPVYNHYGCREFGGIARECVVRDGLHVACERVLVEIEEKGRNTEGIGEILITDLDNKAMPFIRYAIGDLGKMTWQECQCGLKLPRLESTIGREFDVVFAPNGNCLGGTFWTILLRKKGGVKRFQVVQEALDQITIIVAPTEGFSEEVKRYVINEIRKACGELMKVNFEIKENIEMTPAGKHRFVISKLGRHPCRNQGSRMD